VHVGNEHIINEFGGRVAKQQISEHGTNATIEEALFSVDPTDTPIDWLDSDHVICVYCRSMSVPQLYKLSDRIRSGQVTNYELRVTS
jgi:hypothetical protein